MWEIVPHNLQKIHMVHLWYIFCASPSVFLVKNLAINEEKCMNNLTLFLFGEFEKIIL